MVGSGRWRASLLSHGKQISIVVLSQCLFVQPSSSVFLHSASPAARSNLYVVFATVCGFDFFYKIMICKQEAVLYVTVAGIINMYLKPHLSERGSLIQ